MSTVELFFSLIVFYFEKIFEIFDLVVMVCQQSCRFMMAGDGVKQRHTLQEV
jgi:hypothetical protein